MSDRGFFAIDRGVWDHPLFAREKFSEREAWFWLISSAAWEPIRVRVGRAWFDLVRGQCAFALRFLAKKWMWSEPRVRRFLSRLVSDAAVLLLPTREATLITICNYDDYQLSRRTDVSPNDAQTDEPATRPRRKEEGIKQTNKQKKKEEDLSSLRSIDDWPENYGDVFWQAYPRKEEKISAMKKLATLRKSGIVTFADLMAGVKRYCAAEREPQFTKQPTVWLNKGCWADEIKTGASNGNRSSNSRSTGHDAILAAFTRKAREIVGDDAMAGPANTAEFSFGNGVKTGAADRDRAANCGAAALDDGRPSADGRVLEGEIIPPDEPVAGISGYRR
jgi:hypothetical protein